MYVSPRIITLSLKSVKEESFFLQKSAEPTSLHEHKDNVCMI